MNTKTFFLAFLAFAFSMQGIAQNSSGKAIYFDYMAWNQGGEYPPLYIDCGNSSDFNTGNELTLEAWIRVFDAGWNQKVIGKMTDQFDNGYVMGMELLQCYSEVFNPGQNEIKAGTMPLDSSWIHLTTTFKAGDVMAAYINGVKVDEISVPNTPIGSNSNALIIGTAPWDLYSLQYFGHIDEVKVWNIARAEEQINETMFKRLNGDETGLLAYYDFDVSSGVSLPDLSSHGNDGTVMIDDEEYWAWEASYAPVGDETLSQMYGLAAAWPGKGEDTGPYAVTTNGLTLLTDIEFKKPQYVVFGHNSSTGVTTDGLASGIPASFERTAREWYMNKAGNIHSDMLFDLSNAAGGGAELPSDKDVSYYTLFTRASTDQDYQACCCANTKNGDIVTFNNVSLQNNMYYSIGVGDENIAPPAKTTMVEKSTGIQLYPNPAKDKVYIKNLPAKYSKARLFNIYGQITRTYEVTPYSKSIDISGLNAGTYIISFDNEIYERIYIID
jgi:hypothetical protein